MDNLKIQFTEWINEARKQNGEPYSEDTKSNYIGALENYCEKLGNLELKYNNLFYYTNIHDFDIAEKAIKNHHNYDQFNSSRNRIFSSALKIYRVFLNTLNNRGKFETWLEKYPDKKYRSSTVNRYLVALDKCEERLEITLSVFVWEINSIEAFDSVDFEIKNADNYNEVNKAYGNGDLSAALTAYRKFIVDYYEKNADDSWFPSIELYNPGISKGQWLQLLNKEGFLTDKIRYTLAAFYKNGGQASCVELEEKFGNSSDFYRNCGGSFGERAVKETGVPKFGEKDASYWPIAFLGRDAKPKERGNYIWKLRPELYDALTEFEIWNYLSKGGEASMTTKQILDDIKKYIATKGFTYDGSLIENFYLSLKSKPFVILAGTSGTGKTRLAKLFAEAVGAEFKLVPVRPDWSDSSDLFGHMDLSGFFVKGPVIEFISKAIGDPTKPYFLCLDEMNLARVEYYFSDFLSIIETRERKNGRVITDNIEISEKAKEIYGSLYIPDNLYVIGTVNMDETTFPFSKKVLDRANTIEFNYVDLSPIFNEYYDDASPIELQNSFMKTDFIKLSECGEYADYIGTICSELENINKILSKADAHIGYRVRDEICFYMINNKKSELLSDNEAMDNQIMQKILPRIQGSSSAVKIMLCELFKICAGDFEGYQTEINVAGNMMKAAENDSCKYKNSAMKIAGMVRRFEEDGFTSYWI